MEGGCQTDRSLSWHQRQLEPVVAAVLVMRNPANPQLELLAGEVLREALHYELLPVAAFVAEEDEGHVFQARDDKVLLHSAGEQSVAVVVGPEVEAGKESSQEGLGGYFEDASRGEGLGRRV